MSAASDRPGQPRRLPWLPIPRRSAEADVRRGAARQRGPASLQSVRFPGGLVPVPRRGGEVG